ncbi:three-Cys-motif partner protein TcmP [Pelagicoccus enzymogenes]|uniref:three-Cys-motif partner protein TcmP n=1 Tax=Pelagicoccus enzymogenes TaxID=2773457 RepID=UPI00280E11EC|nr:three-Cys-motif partner protein TcmP [Pelagicoccus enzymogenes]MDQ8199685.1 three-Cys-motif partner protein TcmP [Pelagicoccus enzymogenes]
MASSNFHEKPFDEGTLTKLEIFQLYTREWLPVFLAREESWVRSVHLYDFFCGPGTDDNGTLGSPLRTLEVLREYSCNPNLKAWGKVPIRVHFSDSHLSKAKTLKTRIQSKDWQFSGVEIDVQRLRFDRAFSAASNILQARDAAKLLLIDQFGVSHVTPDVFQRLVGSPCTDFLFFISSTTLHRFRDHPAIKQKIKRGADFQQVHYAVLEYYREMLPHGKRYYLAPFSIKKGSNIYGIIFGSEHPRGMDKFLNVAWGKDGLNGTANFDINRDSITAEDLLLDLGACMRPQKLNVFEEDLEDRLRAKELKDESEVMDVCFLHGVQRHHAKPVLKRLKKEGLISIDFQHPSVERFKDPRPIRYKEL